MSYSSSAWVWWMPREKRPGSILRTLIPFSSHLSNTAAKKEETFMEILDICFLLVIANSKPLLFKSPLESLQVEIKFRVYFISSFPWSFSLLLPWVQNQLSNLNRSIPYFFWWLSHPSKKAFHRLQWIILQFAAGTFLIKTFCTNPRSYNFPQIGLPWVCVNRTLALKHLGSEKTQTSLLFYRPQPNMDLIHNKTDKKKSLLLIGN